MSEMVKINKKGKAYTSSDYIQCFYTSMHDIDIFLSDNVFGVETLTYEKIGKDAFRLWFYCDGLILITKFVIMDKENQKEMKLRFKEF